MTDFEFFIATLPDWDGEDRVTELEKLVKMQLVTYAGGGVGTSPVKRLIIEVIRKNTNIMFCGKQGIGKSTFARWLYPFEQEEMMQRGKEVEMVSLPNNSLILETTEKNLLHLEELHIATSKQSITLTLTSTSSSCTPKC